jgi:oligopeptide transport system permease protein
MQRIKQPMFERQKAWRHLAIHRTALGMLAALFVSALIGPLISGYGYSEIHLDLKNIPPGAQFWFGSDELGRDIFTRVWWGARISLFIGMTAAIIDMILGVLWGSIAAYAGGIIEEIMMRIVDILSSIPYLLVAILLTAARGPGIGTILLAMTLTGWINMARIVRGQILQLKQLDYTAAAKALGASPLRILGVHLLPNAMGPILAAMTLTIPTAIFTEAFLSFMGLGVPAPAASWGMMVNDGMSAMRYYPWRLLFPASMITLTMMCFNFLGNALSDRFICSK